jgi:hypothetical protein
MLTTMFPFLHQPTPKAQPLPSAQAPRREPFQIATASQLEAHVTPRAAFADPKLEQKRLDAIARLGERYIAHPSHAPKKGEHVALPPEKAAELRGWIAAAEHLEQTADAIGGTAGAAYRDSAARLRARARDLFAHGVGV